MSQSNASVDEPPVHEFERLLEPFPDARDDEPEKIDLASPESVLFEVIADTVDASEKFSWNGFSIDNAVVLSGAEGITGAASYEVGYGCGLTYLVENLVECPGPGWWVVENVTGTFTHGDGWTTDDDMDFECGSIRPATPEEIASA